MQYTASKYLFSYTKLVSTTLLFHFLIVFLMSSRSSTISNADIYSLLLLELSFVQFTCADLSFGVIFYNKNDQINHSLPTLEDWWLLLLAPMTKLLSHQYVAQTDFLLLFCCKDRTPGRWKLNNMTNNVVVACNYA